MALGRQGFEPEHGVDPSKSRKIIEPFQADGMVKCFLYQSKWRGIYDLPEQPAGHAIVDGAVAINPSCGSCTSSQLLSS